MDCDRFDYTEENCTAVHIGLDWVKTLTFLEDDKVTPIDITGKTYQMRIRETSDGPNILVLDTIVDTALTGFTISVGTDGVLRAKITKTDSATLEDKSYLYDIIETETSGDQFPVMEGSIQAIKGTLS